ncbi:family 20 glycosylhydrolase [Adhaeribacter aquaticus]|uniref:family 20 glycosylhydrolase n=1 Tax=Adhaeribacter aquaticus TaxID=299567 RepID=UPI00041FED9B|nr:family 20 glycosylhydrolase [Adhaeribacter aquaticus]
MKKVVFIAILICQMAFIGCSEAAREIDANTETEASTNLATEAKGFTLTIELPASISQSQGNTKAIFTLTNGTTETLPATGWKLFYNGHSIKTDDEQVGTIKHFNGDLHYLTPSTNFKPLAAGQSTQIAVTSRRVKNITDFPSGFYLVYDKTPNKGIPVALEVKTGNYFLKSDQILAAKIYDQNAKIKDIPAEQLPKVFPTPISYVEKGNAFTFTKEVVIVADKEFRQEADLLAESLAGVTGNKPTVQSQATDKAIVLKRKESLAREGYELTVNPNQILISASSAAGAFYGIQSLKTMLSPAAFSGKENSVQISGVEVKDAPRFSYRGFMMDVARNFQTKEEVLKVLDVMALYKMNVFHFHFSDDEGWRIEIPSLPELTTVGATRAHTTDYKTSISPSYGSGPDAQNTTGTGYYSKADFIDILKYARDRHIEVIPEIESPGHARAAIKAMDARYQRLSEEGKKAEAERYLLRDLNDKSIYRSVQNWNDNVMDVAKPSTYAFLEMVVDELRAMYKEANAPLTTIHFGGDEVPAGVWEKSPSVQQLISKNAGVQTTDDLWYYYFDKINQMLKVRNLFLSGWEEIGLKKVKQNGRVTWVTNPTFANQNFRVNVWKNSPGSGAEDLAYRMANAGYKVILTGVTHLYLDLAYNTSSTEPGQYWGGYVDIDKPFYFIPYNYLKNLKEDDRGNPLNPATIKSREALTAKGKANIVGMEAPLWSETNRSPEQFEYKMLPKLLGVAERAWAKDPQWATEQNAAKSTTLYAQAWSEFINRVGKRELARLDTYAGGFQYRVPTAGAKIINNQVAANVQFPGYTIRYTTNGLEPTAQSAVYSKPISATGTIKLKVFSPAGRAGQTVTIENR